MVPYQTVTYVLTQTIARASFYRTVSKSTWMCILQTWVLPRQQFCCDDIIAVTTTTLVVIMTNILVIPWSHMLLYVFVIGIAVAGLHSIHQAFAVVTFLSLGITRIALD